MLPSATEPDVVPVSTPEQLLAALAAATGPGAARNTVLELQQDVALTQAAGAKYTLPFVIASNRTLTLRGGELGLEAGSPLAPAQLHPCVHAPARLAPRRRHCLHRVCQLSAMLTSRMHISTLSRCSSARRRWANEGPGLGRAAAASLHEAQQHAVSRVSECHRCVAAPAALWPFPVATVLHLLPFCPLPQTVMVRGIARLP